MNRPPRFCEKHGGDVPMQDSYFLCDTCARDRINPCKCGSHARYFGEALMCSVSCETCNEFVMHLGGGKDVRALWNEGVRGSLD